MTPEEVLTYLPEEPPGYYYSVEQMSTLVQRVWLNHKCHYNYNSGEPVKTIWGFIKSGKVHTAKNYKQAKARSVCSIVDAHQLPSYSSYRHNITDITIFD